MGYLQCFDTVGWVPGRVSGDLFLKNDFGIFQHTLVTFYGWDEEICNLVVWNFLGIPYTKTTKPSQPLYDHFSATTRRDRDMYTHFAYVVAYCYTARTHDSFCTNFQVLHIIIIIIWKFMTRTCSQALSMHRRRGQSLGGYDGVC